MRLQETAADVFWRPERVRVSDGLAGTWSRLGWADGFANFFCMA